MHLVTFYLKLFLFSRMLTILLSSPIPLRKRTPRRLSLKDGSSTLGKFLGVKSSGAKADLESFKVPQYMIDLYKRGIPQGTIVRSFFNEAPSSSTPGTKQYLFNLADIAKGEKIYRASLRLFKLHGHPRKKHFLPVEVWSKGSNRLLTSKDLSCGGSDWHSFDVTDTVKKWVSNPTSNKGFKVMVKRLLVPDDPSCDIKFATNQHGAKEPILVVYSGDGKQGNKSTTVNINLTKNKNAKLSNRRKKRLSTVSGCNKVDMWVDVEKISWDRWILQPKVFNAFRCSGSCAVYSSQQSESQTNHATVQAIVSEIQPTSGTKISSPCCAPKELDSMSMLFYERTGTSFVVKLQTLDEMIVRSCACL